MDWLNASDERPGFSIYRATDSDGNEYVAQKKREGLGIWRLATRASSDEPLRIIYTADTLAECKEYAAQYGTTESMS